jgi:hypothetical protein
LDDDGILTRFSSSASSLSQQTGEEDTLDEALGDEEKFDGDGTFVTAADDSIIEVPITDESRVLKVVGNTGDEQEFIGGGREQMPLDALNSGLSFSSRYFPLFSKSFFYSSVKLLKYLECKSPPFHHDPEICCKMSEACKMAIQRQTIFPCSLQTHRFAQTIRRGRNRPAQNHC